MASMSDIDAINDYVMNRSQPAAGAPLEVMDKWSSGVQQWKGFYSKMKAAWYISDSDLATAKAIRNKLMQNQNPDSWQYVQETAADIAANKMKSHAEKPDAPGEKAKPWVAEGLTYSGKYKTPAQVSALQKEINAAGYKPPLKVDGKYGPATQAGEKWLNLQKAGKAAETEIKKTAATAGTTAPTPPKQPTPTAEKVVTKAPPRILGFPITVSSVVGAVAGGAVGFVAGGGPLGAVIGIPTGFVGGSMFGADPEDEE